MEGYLIAGYPILLGIIGYFVVRFISGSDKANKELRESVDKLSMTITGLNASIIVLQERHDAMKKEFDDHKDVCKYKYIMK